MSDLSYDVIIVGAGMIGLALASRLAMEGFEVAVFDAKVPSLTFDNAYDSRTVALNPHSHSLLEAIGAWSYLPEDKIGWMSTMDVEDLGGGELHFYAHEFERSVLAYVVENRELVKALWQRAYELPHLCLYAPIQLKRLDDQKGYVRLLTNQGDYQASLLIGADGVHSWVRHQLAIEEYTRDDHQEALVAIVAAQKPHQDRAWQLFLADGVLGLLPLGSSTHLSLIWSVAQKRAQGLKAIDTLRFDQELNEVLGGRLGVVKTLGSLSSQPLVWRHAKRYIAPQVALVGDAAHTIHPLAGQGANLGFWDVDCLARCLVQAKTYQRAFSSPRVLRQYERERVTFNRGMITLLKGLKVLFSEQALGVSQARSVALSAMDRCVGLKRFFSSIVS